MVPVLRVPWQGKTAVGAGGSLRSQGWLSMAEHRGGDGNLRSVNQLGEGGKCIKQGVGAGAGGAGSCSRGAQEADKLLCLQQ